MDNKKGVGRFWGKGGEGEGGKRNGKKKKRKKKVDVGLIRTGAPEGTRFLVLRVRPLRHHALDADADFLRSGFS